MKKVAASETVAMSEKEPLMLQSQRMEAAVMDNSGEPSYSSFPDPRVGQSNPTQVELCYH